MIVFSLNSNYGYKLRRAACATSQFLHWLVEVIDVLGIC